MEGPAASLAPVRANDAPKRVLVIVYSQTGQLTRVAERILAPLQEERDIVVHVETLKPEPAYPFPWPFFRFLDAFPESALMVPPRLAPLSLHTDDEFDLVIVFYQVWFLAPSPPITAFLKHPIAQKLLRGRPVVTVIACRNMWLMAHDKVKSLLAAVGARLIDNVVLTDPGPTLATFITTPRWLLSGNKQAFWGLPAAGLNEEQIRGTRRFGIALRDALLQDRETAAGPLLQELAAVNADPHLYVSEKTGTRSFYLWGKLLRAAGPPGSWQRVPLLAVYVVVLVALIVTVVPLSLALQAALRPLLRQRLARMKHKFELPSGSGTGRMHTPDE